MWLWLIRHQISMDHECPIRPRRREWSPWTSRGHHPGGDHRTSFFDKERMKLEKIRNKYWIHVNSLLMFTVDSKIPSFLIFFGDLWNLWFTWSGHESHASPCLGDASRPAFGRPGTFRKGRSKNPEEDYTGWWLSHPSEKYMKVSWDYYGSLFSMYGKIKFMFQTSKPPTSTAWNQPHFNMVKHLSSSMWSWPSWPGLLDLGFVGIPRFHMLMDVAFNHSPWTTSKEPPDPHSEVLHFECLI